MPPISLDTARRIDALLRDLGPQLRRGGPPTGSLTRLPAGIPDIDRLLGGGFPRGALSEIAGPASSGRTSLALALLARTTRAGEVTAVVDGSDAFDPTSAEAAGVALERVLWVRAPGPHQALRSAEQLLKAHGFALVLLDRAGGDPRVTPATWPRLARAAAGAAAALVVLSAQRGAGSAAALGLEMKPGRAHFAGTPALLEGLEIEAILVRHRAAPADRRAGTLLNVHFEVGGESRQDSALHADLKVNVQQRPRLRLRQRPRSSHRS